MNKRYKAIIFDVGDTLLFRVPSNYSIFTDRCAQIGIRITEQDAKKALKKSEIWTAEQILNEINGSPRMPDHEFYRNVDFVSLKAVLNNMTDSELWKYVDKLKDVEGKEQKWFIGKEVADTLSQLAENGFILGIASNFTPALPSLLKEMGIYDYFNEITVSSLVGIEKPDARILQICCSNLGVNACDSIYVGDHPFDILCAKKAGLDMAWLCDEWNWLPDNIICKEDYKIKSIDELLSIV